MSLKLILMRHAKSGWDDPTLSDHQRGLNPRGQISAPAVGAWLQAKGHLPDLVLSSDPTRTRETWVGLGIEAEERFLRDLYLAQSHTMLEVLRQGGAAQTVLMLGHSPGIAEFAQSLAKRAPQDGDFRRYPTCATTVFQFNTQNWAEVRAGTGEVLEFTVPRRLI